MDDTQQSRASDAAAAATRKRRSSILKSQRPARTPFSELEFNVATPTDTAKSRRVSFSRRTGVAEFVTNEATTTWKNFYEEHNKSLESSNNDSGANASRQPVGHLGKRIFDQQFEEVEAVDFISGLANGSLNNVNFSQQLASLETTDTRLTAPQNKFELSAFTEQSKLFGNDFTACNGENSGRIDINFSAMQPVEKDDLDEIEKDLERGSNMGCHGPFGGRQNMSEYIEVDLNMTHVVQNDEDMSITDTVHSPVQDVSRSASIDKKVSLNNDWVVDKENIAVNPYAAPTESNFAADEPDQVLVFDGKRLTLQPDVPPKDKNYRQTLLPNSSADTPQRKTIVLNVNDDLPNFIDDMLNSKCDNSVFSGFQEIKTDDHEISETRPVSGYNKSKRNTIHDNTGNISMTCALPTNIICHSAVITQDNTKRRPTVFDESTSNISMTESVPAKLMTNSVKMPERRRTIVYEDDTGNLSMTQAVPSNILASKNGDKHKTIVFDTDEGNISVTQAISSNFLDVKANKRRTIVFDDDACNISMTQSLPANILSSDIQERRRTIIYENDNDDGNISVTQAIPKNVILTSKASNPETVIYEDNTADISVTQSLQSNVILERNKIDNKENVETSNLVTEENVSNNISVKTSDVSRKTIVYEDDTGDVSITQAIPTQLLDTEEKALDPMEVPHTNRTNKRTTIVYDNDTADVSMTEVISTAIIDEAKKNKRETVVFDTEEDNISMTVAVSTNVFLLDKLDSAVSVAKTEENLDENEYEDNLLKTTFHNDQKSTVFDADDCVSEMSMTMAVPHELTKRKTVVFDEDNCDISMTKPIPAELLTFASNIENKSKIQLDLTELDQGANQCTDVIVLQASTTNSMPSLAPTPAEQGDLKSTRDIYRNMISESKVMSYVNVIENSTCALEEETSGTHPKVEMKAKQLNLVSSDTGIDQDEKVSYTDEDAITQTEQNEPRLDSLDMSTTTIDSGMKDKNIMTQIKSDNSSVVERKEISPSETMFYVMKDSDVVIQTDLEVDSEQMRRVKTEISSEGRDVRIEDSGNIDVIQKKLEELKAMNNSTKFCEAVVGSDSDAVERDETTKLREQTQSIMKANDTKELLDMISSFTDNRDSEDDESAVVAIKVKPHSEKSDADPRRLSFAPKRQSIALSREDLLSNISMAQAALQQSRLRLDDTESPEDDTTSGDTSKKGRTSNEVVKTLHFDDESVSETSMKSHEKLSPLKKTAFGESTYMTENKGKVIPTYLKDVSDGIKELMLDLVKPMADNVPFDATLIDRGVVKNPSTHSTQIQANLFTSSQVDLDADLYSNPDTNIDLKSSMTCEAVTQQISCFRSPVKFSSTSSERTPEFDEPSPKHIHFQPPPVEQCPSEVLVFDHLNPLNNVLLPLNYTDAHKYDPSKPEEAHQANEHAHSAEIRYLKSMRDNKLEIENRNRFRRRSYTQGSDYGRHDDQHSSLSGSSRRMSSDRSSGAALVNYVDGEVNTVIAMRQNKELLEASSSLTLVDDAIDDNCKTPPDRTESEPQRLAFSRSHLNDIEEQAAEMDKLSAMSMLDYSSKGKKRFFSPSTDKHRHASVDVTPKQTTKMQKRSNSPNVHRVSIGQVELPRKMTPEKDVPAGTKSPEKDRLKVKKAAPSITVQQLITDFKQEINILESLNPKSESITECSQSEVSFSSSKNMNAMDVENTSATHCQPTQGAAPPMEWQPELSGVPSYSVVSTESGINVVAKIDMLPFMGSHECEWESSPPDTWAFRLLHGRLRLTVRLAHRHDNATRTRVRGDTPVTEMAVETVQLDKNPVASLCVRFACETIRHVLGARACVAADVPAVLRRAAAAARVALRWGRAMHDAKLHLAYTLDHDGNLSLKVANIPLRSVWEVRMRVELALQAARAPCPRAAHVRVLAVVSDERVPEHDVRRALAHVPSDWGHAPTTICPLRWEVRMRVQLARAAARAPCPRAAHVRVLAVVSDERVPEHDVRRALAHVPSDWGHAPTTICPLRWEVRMRVQLARAAARAPCPRAAHVRVLAVVSDERVPEHDVRRALAHVPSDWGHAPTTICPLRWEVRMRVQLARAAARAPCPRAAHVRVLAVVSDERVPEHDVRRALAHVPSDWGHAPTTICPLRWEVRMRVQLARAAARAPCPRAAHVRVLAVVSDERVPEHDVRRALAHVPSDWGHAPTTICPLRWEVRMRVQLARAAARAPWPRAAHVRVLAVVSDERVPEHDVRRALAHVPSDWGHAPTTIWRIFRYLKEKKRDDLLA